MPRFFIKEKVLERKDLKTDRQVYNSFKKLEMSDQESFWIICYDQQDKTILVDCVFMGGEDICHIYKRLLFRRIFSVNTYGFRIIHNHPNGTLDPSKADIELTKQLAIVSNLIGLEFIDHMIIGQNDFYSFRFDKNIKNLNEVSALM